MCGISGCVGSRKGVKDTLDCLKMLEYRGYDSSGIAFFNKSKIKVIKAVGNLKNLLKKVAFETSQTAVIGHTRWATHGKPTLFNAHPHTDNRHIVALVHNGIIDNYESLRANLIQAGVLFHSQTDTEVLAQYLGKELSRFEKITAKKVLQVMRGVLGNVKGSFAVAFVVTGLNNRIFFAKKSSPLIIGGGNKASFLASDTNALIGKCQQIYHVKDDEFGFVGANDIQIFSLTGSCVKAEFIPLNVSKNAVQLGRYDSYLHKEIDEGAGATIMSIKNCMREIDKILPANLLAKNPDIHIVACGSALHSGRVLKYLIEHELRRSVNLDYASEFKYNSPLVSKRSLCIFISQSGETADTLGCVDIAKQLGATTIGITNVQTSRLASVVDYCLFTYAGAEISVASTKAYLSQLGLAYVLVLFLAKCVQKRVSFTTKSVIDVLVRGKNKGYYEKLKPFVNLISNQKSMFFVGRGLDYFVAMEGALKLKEVCYIHSESIPAGELKHGSLALIDQNSVVIAVLTQARLIDKMLNNIHEINSRGAKIILISPFLQLQKEVFGFVKIPRTPDLLSPLVAIKPLQELTLYTALHKHINPDQPRNLAKSVTVE